MMSGMHDCDKTRGGVVQDDELTMNNIFKTPPAAKLNLRCVIKAGFQDVAEKRIPLPNMTNTISLWIPVRISPTVNYPNHCV